MAGMRLKAFLACCAIFPVTGCYARSLPSLLLSQVASTVPKWILPGVDVRFTKADSQHGKRGAVSSESSICSNIGINMLKQGGNAADAMVATTLCVGVIGMYHSGIGGGGFMLVRSSNGTFEDIDFRETAPAAAYQDMYKNNTRGSVYTGLASGVPGELRGLAYLHENYGALPWRTVVMPAVKVARTGWKVNHDLVRYMTAATNAKHNFLVENPTWAIDFAPNGTLLGVGDTITRRRYADTLETIAQQGAEAFYTGPMADAMIQTIQAHNGTMTSKDLEGYALEVREPAAITYRDYILRSCSAPSAGTVALSVMKIVEGFSTIGHADLLNLSTHRFDEATRFAYGQRTEMGDPDYVTGMYEFQAEMLNTTSAALTRSKIKDDYTLPVKDYNPNGFEVTDSHGTSAVVTSDASGLAISLTTTINLLFGSQVMVPETGVILNDEMNDFSIPGASNAFGYPPSPSNYIQPGKRPLSSITPFIVEHANGSLYYVVAAAGGSRIITSTLQNLWHVLDHNMSAPEALAAPRFHDQLIPNRIAFEYGFDNGTTTSMSSRGHNVSWMGLGSSSAQSLRLLSNGTFEAAGEPRQVNSGGYVF